MNRKGAVNFGGQQYRKYVRRPDASRTVNFTILLSYLQSDCLKQNAQISNLAFQEVPMAPNNTLIPSSFWTSLQPARFQGTPEIVRIMLEGRYDHSSNHKCWV